MPSSSVPPRFEDRTLDSFVAATEPLRRALDAAQRYGFGDLSSLVLVGPTGTGKTHLAAGAARARFEREHAAWAALPWRERYPDKPWDHQQIKDRPEPAAPLWCSVIGLIVGLRAEIGAPRGEREWAERAETLRSWTGTVVLDDLGQEKSSDWTGETIYVIVNDRYESRLPTIVTTNLAISEIAESPYWPALSRLAEDGALVKVLGEDHRL